VSYDVGLQIDVGGEVPFSISGPLNYTYNMSYAIRHGCITVYACTCEAACTCGAAHLFCLAGATAGDAIEPLTRAIEIIKRDAVALRAREPTNGWGSVDGLLRHFLEPLLAMCREAPKATIWCR